MDQKAETERKALGVQQKTREESGITLDDVRNRAFKAYKEAKKQADIVHKEAKKLAVDKEDKKAADQAHKEAMEQAQTIRDKTKSQQQ